MLILQWVTIMMLCSGVFTLRATVYAACSWLDEAGSWFEEDHWSGLDCEGVPTADDTVTIGGIDADVTIENGAAEAAEVTVYAGRLTVREGGTLSIVGDGQRMVLGEHDGVTHRTGILVIGAAAGEAAAGPGIVATSEIEMGRGDDGDGTKASGLIVFNHTSDGYVFSPNLTGVGGIQQESGTTVLSGVNTYAGTTVVNGGILRAGSSDSFVQGGDYVVSGGSLELNNFDLTMSSLSGDGGKVVLGALSVSELDDVTLTISQNIDTTFGGAIVGSHSQTKSGQISLIKDGTGVLALTGDSKLRNSGNTAEVRVFGGELRVLEGGKMEAGSLTVGSGHEDAAFRVVGAGSGWSGYGEMQVGSVGQDALISVADGASFEIRNQDALIAHTADSKARVEVLGGSTWDHVGPGSELLVGYKGEGTFTIGEGSQVTSFRSEIGRELGSRGTVILDGAGSNWRAQDVLRVGAGGEGHLSITNGGALLIATSTNVLKAAVIGVSQGAEGHVLISGDGSSWRSSEVTIGSGGFGSLTVEGGGAIESSVIFGQWESGEGTAVVSGADSVWTTNFMEIGVAGKGSLTLTEGGRVDPRTSISTTWITLASNATASGVLNIGGGGAPGTLTKARIVFGAGDGRLVFDHTDAQYHFDGVSAMPVLVSEQPGKGLIEHVNGTTYLWVDGQDFSGETLVRGGTLFVPSDLGGTATVRDTGTLYVDATFRGAVTVRDGGTLSGEGSVGSAAVEDGGILAPGNIHGIGALTIDGSLTLTSASALHFTFGRPGSLDDPFAGVNGHLFVKGDVTLDGMLHVSQSDRPEQDGTIGFGYYRLITYNGAFTDHGLQIGSFPEVAGGVPELVFSPGRVDLFVASLGDDTLQHWQGGDGEWNATDAAWLNDQGDVLVKWAGNHAVFKNEPGGFDGGAIDVAETLSFKGLQFVDEGFRLYGDGALVTDDAGSEIRVLADQAEIATEITGAGHIVKTQGGTLVLSGVNTYTGGTVIAGGAVQVSEDANLGASSGGLTLRGGALQTSSSFAMGREVSLELSGGVFHVEQLDALTAPSLELSGRITGEGALRKTGSGELVLSSSDNDYSGGTVIESGVVDVRATGALGTGAVTVDGSGSRLRLSGSANAGEIHIASGNGGTVELVGGATADRATIVIGSDGTVDISGTIDGASIGSLSGAGEVILGAKTLTVGNLGKNDTFDGILVDYDLGGGLIKIGQGTLTLNGDHHYTGATEVKGGHLEVNGSIASSSHITVYDGASIGGAGALGSMTMATGSTLAAGNSIGTLTIHGDLVLEQGARFEVEVNPEGDDADFVKVTGKAVLNGGSVLHVGVNGNYRPFSTYRILKADGGLVGEFDDVSSDFAFLDPKILYDYDEFAIDLQLIRNDVEFAAMASTFNQRSAAAGVESLGIGNDVYDAMLTLAADPASTGPAFDSLSGEIHASLKTALIGEGRLVRQAVAGHTSRFAAAGQGLFESAGSESGAGRRSWGHWLREQGAIDTDGNAAAMARMTSGFLVGLDSHRIDDWSIGFAIGHSRSTYEVADRGSTASGDAFYLGGYGGTTWGATSFGMGIALSAHDLRTERSVQAGSLAELVSARYSGRMEQVFAEFGHRLRAGLWVLEPFANAAYITLRTGGFTEDGGAAALSVDRHAMATTMASAGVRLESVLGEGKAAIRSVLGWVEAFGDTVPQTMHGIGDSEKFAVAGLPVAAGVGFVDLGLEINLASNATLSVVYSGQFGAGARHHAINVAIGRVF